MPEYELYIMDDGAIGQRRIEPGVPPEPVVPPRGEGTSECDRCGVRAWDEDMTFVTSDYGQVHPWCSTCTEYRTFLCGECETVYSVRFMSRLTVEDRTICGTCAEDLPFCEECGEYYQMEEAHRHPARAIKSYSHKPRAVFHPEIPPVTNMNGNRNDLATGTLVDARTARAIPRQSVLQFGIELEVENHGNEDTNEAAWDFMHQFDESILCLKYDGSLMDGFEIVVHPRSLASWHEFAPRFGDALMDLRRKGFQAWSDAHCGLHIHSSKAGYDGVAHVTRFGMLFARNEEEWIRVAGRDTRNNACNYASFSALRQGGVGNKAKGLYPTGHTDAVNLHSSGQPTTETRIWRPSLAGSGRVISSIEFVHAAIEYTRTMTARDVAAGSIRWDQFVQYIKEHEYPQAQFVLGGGRFEKVSS